MKCLLFLALAVANAQPPAIVVFPEGERISAVLLVTKDLPTGTAVLPNVTKGRARTFLPVIPVSLPGAYPLGSAPNGAEFGAYFALPDKTFRLRTAHFLSGYEYEGNRLTIHGTFTGEKVFVYFDTSLAPAILAAAEGKIIIVLHPSNMPTIVTVYQAGVCDSLLVRLIPRALVKERAGQWRTTPGFPNRASFR